MSQKTSLPPFAELWKTRRLNPSATERPADVSITFYLSILFSVQSHFSTRIPFQPFDTSMLCFSALMKSEITPTDLLSIRKFTNLLVMLKISTFGRLQHVKHTSNTAQRRLVKHVKHFFGVFLVLFRHNSAKSTIGRSVKLLMHSPHSARRNDNTTITSLVVTTKNTGSAYNSNY